MVAKIGAGNGVLHEVEVDAGNWMGALRKARESMSERPSVPPGVSCSIDGEGVATVLDAATRRKFVLAPLAELPAAVAAAAPAPHAAAPHAAAPHAAPAAAAPPAPQPRPAVVVPTPAVETQAASADASGKRKRFQTVAFTDGMAAAAGGAVLAVGGTAHEAIRPPMPPVGQGASLQVAASVSSAPRRPSMAAEDFELELIYTRDAEPTEDNPLAYRERAYLAPRGVPIPEAEARLRTHLDVLKQELVARPRGKLVNLAVFDHRFRDAPERPPIVSLQWRDWRDDVVVEYPASVRQSSLPPPPGPSAHDDRLAEVFEALEALMRKTNAADGLDFGVQLIERMVPCEAISACLYDINTDELRFVAVLGAASEHVQGMAVPRNAGLFAQAVRAEGQATLVRDVLVDPAFNPAVDSRPGLDAQSVLLRPMAHERQLVGILQLVNRKHTAGFDAADVNIVSYIAERLAEFVLQVRRSRSKPPAARK